MVLKYLLILIFLVQLNAGVESNNTDNYLLRVLDGLQLINTGHDKYNRTIYEKLTSCMNRIDPTLEIFLNRGWEEAVNFWIEKKDEWGKDCSYTAGEGDLWESNDKRVPNLKGLVLQEPCNVASKQSTLQNIIEICKRMDKGPAFNLAEEKVKIYAKCMAHNAFAGGFYHAARSHRTSIMVNPFDRIYQVIFEDLVELLPTNSTIVKAFGEETKANADQLVNIFHKVVIEKKYDSWSTEFGQYNVKRYRNHLLGITSIFACILEPENPIEVLDEVFDYLSQFLRMKEENMSMKPFFVEKFIPEVQKLIPLMNLTTSQKEFIRERSYAVGALFAYSIIYYGEVPMKKNFGLAKYPSSNSNEFFMKKLLRMKIPFSSYVADMAAKNNFYSSNYETYPGEKECSLKYGHPRWHAIGRKAYLEAMYLVDDIYGMLKKKKSQVKKEKNIEAVKSSLETKEVSIQSKSEATEAKDRSNPPPRDDRKEGANTSTRRTIRITIT